MHFGTGWTRPSRSERRALLVLIRRGVGEGTCSCIPARYRHAAALDEWLYAHLRARDHDELARTRTLVTAAIPAERYDIVPE